MATVRRFILDMFAWLNHKEAMQTGRVSNNWGWYRVPGWIRPEDQRRLTSYVLLAAYYMNNSKEMRQLAMPTEDRDNIREYGDSHLIVQQTLSSLIGDDQQLIVPGKVGGEDSYAVDVYDRLVEWMDDVMFNQKLIECERNAIKLGDGVYVMGIDPQSGSLKLTVWDPGMYFPVLDDEHLNNNDYPSTVNIAYEYEHVRDDGSKEQRLRRIRWQLMETSFEPSGEMDPETGMPVMNQAVIGYPWGNSTKFCVFSDAWWSTEDLGTDVYALDDSRANWNIPPTDIGVDFIPVIHIPNTVAGQEHFGVSVLSPILQIFDDISSVDTDLQAASATTGSPPLVIQGAYLKNNEEEDLLYGPGTVLQTGDGNATLIDTSRSLDSLIKYSEKLLERLSVNGRMPASLLGRIKPNEVPSGIALTLSFTPHSSMIKEGRLVREHKYALLFKMAHRFLMLLGELAPSTDKLRIKLKFGSFLPADKSEVKQLVVELYQAKAISLETAVTMLVTAGFPIDDALEEVDRIRSVDFDAANQAIIATGDVNVGREFLGLPPVESQPVDANQEFGNQGGLNDPTQPPQP